jgi:flagellar hook-length control protein FliK
MMGALQHSPAPGALPPVFAALGSPGAIGGEMPTFDQLVAAAPMPVLAEAQAGVALPPPVAAMPGQPIADAAVAALPAATPPIADSEIASDAPPSHDDAAAKAATLLLAVAGKVAAPVAGQIVAQAAALPDDSPASRPVTTTPAGGDADSEAEPAAVSIEETVVPTAFLNPAPAAPATPKPAEPADTAREGDAQAQPAAARPRDAAQLAMLATDFTLPKAKIADAGASMTILFTQPAIQTAATLAEAAPMAPVTERVLDLTSDDAWIEQLAHDIAATKSQNGDISFRLMPRHLGRLDVAMRQEEGGVSLKLDTRHEATATVVQAAQGRLVEDLRQQGVRVASAEVTCTPGESGRPSQQGTQQGQGRGAAHDPAHLIETAPERAEPRDEERAADRGRFA